MDTPNEQKEYVLINTTEELVKRKVKMMMEDEDMCHCDKCFYDVCALILNKMPPNYVTTEKGQLMFLLNTTNNQFLTDMMVYAWQAIKKVKECPQH